MTPAARMHVKLGAVAESGSVAESGAEGIHTCRWWQGLAGAERGMRACRVHPVWATGWSVSQRCIVLAGVPGSAQSQGAGRRSGSEAHGGLVTASRWTAAAVLQPVRWPAAPAPATVHCDHSLAACMSIEPSNLRRTMIGGAAGY